MIMFQTLALHLGHTGALVVCIVCTVLFAGADQCERFYSSAIRGVQIDLARGLLLERMLIIGAGAVGAGAAGCAA
jgi:hypothetical protein